MNRTGLLAGVAIGLASGASVARGQCPLLSELPAPDAATQDWFGYSVAASGDILVVGARLDDNEGGIDAGAGYVYQYGQGNFDLVTRLTASDASPGDSFGVSVAIGGDIIVVGALSQETVNAYVFARNQGGPDNWGEVTTITGSDTEAADFFGTHASVSGDIVVVGAPSNGDTGAAYVFARNEGGADNWGEVRKLLPSDATPNAGFRIVSVSGDLIVVGAPLADDLCPSDPQCDSGAVYLFARDHGGANNWGQFNKLTAGDASEGARFGTSTFVSGDIIMAGATGDAGNSGAVYVFDRNQGGPDLWGQVKKITATDASPESRFGFSIWLGGDVLAVGSPGLSSGSPPSSAYSFVRDAGGLDNWGQTNKLVTPNAPQMDLFGRRVAVITGIAVVGAPQDGDPCPGTPECESGAVYLFDPTGADCNTNGICDSVDIANGTSRDCNENLIPDECDIESGLSDDHNGDGVPDECQPCQLADIDGDGEVDVGDFLILLGQWGPCPPVCIADIDGDGVIGILDFLILLGSWGPCP